MALYPLISGFHLHGLSLIPLQSSTLCDETGVVLLDGVQNRRNCMNGTLIDVRKIVASAETAAGRLVVPVASSTCWLSINGWNRDAN
jgi:hypothetical protein